MKGKRRNTMKQRFMTFVSAIGFDHAEEFVSCSQDYIRECGDGVRNSIMYYVQQNDLLKKELAALKQEADVGEECHTILEGEVVQ